MGISFGHLMVLLFIVLILFGAGRLPRVMSDMGKGIRSFREGLKDEQPVKQIAKDDDPQ